MVCWISRSATVGIPNSRISSPRLGNLHPAHGFPPVLPIQEFLPDLGPLGLEVPFVLFHRQSTHPGPSLVGFEAFSSRHHSYLARRPARTGLLAPSRRLYITPKELHRVPLQFQLHHPVHRSDQVLLSDACTPSSAITSTSPSRSALRPLPAATKTSPDFSLRIAPSLFRTQDKISP